MRVSREEVMNMARIAKLSTNEEDIKKYQEKLEDLLEFVDALKGSGGAKDEATTPMKYAAWVESEAFSEGRDSRKL